MDFFVYLRALERLRVKAGDHTGDIAQIAHALELTHLVKVIGEGEAVGAKLFRGLKRLLLVEALLRLFYEREHVAHAEDARGHAVGMEGLYHVELLAHADELDGLARGRP